MKPWMTCFLIGIAGVVAAGAAEEVFSKTVRPGEYAAAGLHKLSAEEVARLDALVRDYKSGALARALRDAAAAEARAAQAEKRAAEPKVVVAPGTKVEIATVESRIAGEFRGWELRTVFTLENGQRWQVTSGDPYVTPPVAGPRVKITPGMLGSYWMVIEGIRSRVKVVPIGGGG